LSHGATGLT